MSKGESNEFRPALEAAIASFGLEPLTESQINRMAAHFQMLCKWNQRVNLTRIIKPREAAKLHYAESIFGARFIGDEHAILDIGSGAGFPAIPMAIVRPDLEVTAIEANQKKALFLKEVKDALELGNLNVINARLEDFDWSAYALLTSRALERAETVFQTLIDHMGVNQRLMLYCTAELAAKLGEHAPPKSRVATHAIPHSESRVVAVFSIWSAPPHGKGSS
ncbi:MAG TPA: 16S rRNA (guanine(527)-N(7))-methyltransferase RsmG [Blastocatellia bacterium]|nr:16S rRNA (guanine(527)-N(7))-methyltransferase RsmG [Blastocatellia bacterium]